MDHRANRNIRLRKVCHTISDDDIYNQMYIASRHLSVLAYPFYVKFIRKFIYDLYRTSSYYYTDKPRRKLSQSSKYLQLLARVNRDWKIDSRWYILDWYIIRCKNVIKTLFKANKYGSNITYGKKGKVRVWPKNHKKKTIKAVNLTDFSLGEIWREVFVPSQRLHGIGMSFCSLQHQEYCSSYISGTH